jgi:predicted PurR-regulated permease PerM
MLRPIDYSRVFWIGLAIVLAGILAVVIITFLGTFVLGLFLYYAARPIYVRLRRRVRPASLAAAIALFVLILPVILLFWYTVALGIRQLLSIGTLDLSAYETLLAPYLDSTGLITELRTLVQSLAANPEQLLTGGQLQGIAMELLATLSTYLGVVLTGLLHLFVALALAFYLLRDGDRLVEWVHGHFPNETLVTYGRTVDADLKTVFFGNILNALLTGTVAAIVFSLLGVLAPPSVPVPVPILLGLLAGAGSLVPVVGMKIVYVPVTLYLTGLAALSDPRLFWFPLVFFAVTFVIIDTIPDLVLRPYPDGTSTSAPSCSPTSSARSCSAGTACSWARCCSCSSPTSDGSLSTNWSGPVRVQTHLRRPLNRSTAVANRTLPTPTMLTIRKTAPGIPIPRTDDCWLSALCQPWLKTRRAARGGGS